MTRFTVPSLLTALVVVLGCGGFSPSKSEEGKKDNDAEEIDIVGRYTYKSTVPGGEETGTVDVTKDGETYKLEYLRSDKVTYSGVAIRSNDLLSISWRYPGAGESGVEALRISSGPKLVGYWAHSADGKRFPDTWTSTREKK